MIDLPSKSEIKIRIKDILYANILEIAESKNLLADEVIEILIEYGVNLMNESGSNTKEYKNVTLAVVDVLPEKKDKPEEPPFIVSFCCRAKLTVVKGGEGTAYHKCTKCGNPANQYLPGFQKEKSSSTFVSPSTEDKSKPFTGSQENENGALEKETDSELRSTFANGSNSDQIKRWCRKYDQCLKCGRTDRKHAGKGFCYVCYATLYEKQKREEIFPPKDPNKKTFTFDNYEKKADLSKAPKVEKKEASPSEYIRPEKPDPNKKYCAYLHCPQTRIKRHIETMIKGDNGGYYCSHSCCAKNRISG